MRTCLVTGGAGFIGSHMAERLLEEDYRVVILDNESTGLRQNVPAAADYVRGDTARIDDVRRAFGEGIDVVFHIAGQASTIRSFSAPLDDLTTNVNGTVNVVQMCLEYRVPRLLFASSMTVYGHPSTIPVAETEPAVPISYYGITKYAAERYVHATAERTDLDFDFNVTSFRMFNVYGERQRLDNPYQGVVSIFISNVLDREPITIFGDGQQSRDFVHIRDAVDAWVAAIDNPAAYGQVFNLGMGVACSINDLVDKILAAFDVSRRTYPVTYAPARPGDQRHMAADVTKAKRLLAWQPTITLDDGMQPTIAWSVKHVGVADRVTGR